MSSRPPAIVPAEINRYRRVGLTHNPFSAAPSHDPHEPGTGSWFVDRGIPRPPPPGSRTVVQVIGDQGMGKSTHLAEWRRLQPGPLHYIPRRRYRDRWSRPPVETMVYGDEIDRMPTVQRAQWLRRLARVDATVVIGTHRDLSAAARRAGFEVRSDRLAPASPDELAAVLNRRLQAAAVPGRELCVAFTEADVDAIHCQSDGNLRATDSSAHRILADRVRHVGDTA